MAGLGIGLIGCGRWGQLLARAVQGLHGARMVEAAEEHGIKLMCGQVTRLYPIYRRAAELARSGRLGRLAAVHVTDLMHIDRVGWWARSETMGALLHSPGVHFIDYVLSVCGRATSVYAVEIIDAAYQSIACPRPVELPLPRSLWVVGRAGPAWPHMGCQRLS